MEGFCLKQQWDIMAQMHLSLHQFLSEHGNMWHFWPYSYVIPLSLGPVPSFQIHGCHTSFSLPLICSSFTSSVIFFLCVCAHQSMIQFAFVHIQFPTLFDLLFKKKNHEENIWFTFAYFLSVFSVTGVSFLSTWVWWWCSLLYLLGKQYCIFSAFNSLNYFTFWRSWRIPVGHIEYV